MKKEVLAVLSSVFLLTGLLACTGPTGPAGPTGPTGPAGPSDVRYSPWFTATGNSEDVTIDGTCLRLRRTPRADLTADVINKAMIMVYFRVGSIGPYALPYLSDAGGATNEIGFTLRTVGELHVYRHTLKSCRFNSGIPESYPGEPVLVNLPQSLEYRYVIVPGTVALAGANVGIDLKKMSYAEVKDRFNIPD